MKAMRLAFLINMLRPRNLFAKYVLSFVGVVVFVLASSAAIETYFIYRETITSLVHTQEEKAIAAAKAINQYLPNLERSISWATRASSTTTDQRLADYNQLLRTTPAIAEVALLDATGQEALRVSRTRTSIGSNSDLSRSAAFLGVKAGHGESWFGPPFFENDVPYTTIAIPHGGRNAGLMLAKVDLGFLSDIVNDVQAGGNAATLVVSKLGKVIARSDSAPSILSSSTAKIGADLSKLPQVNALNVPEPNLGNIGRDTKGNAVLFASANVPTLQAAVLVEQPRSVALAPVYDLLLRLGTLSLISVFLSIAAGAVLARRMAIPIQALKAGAVRLASGEFSEKIEVKTGDEIEVLADEFNHMASELKDLYSALEQKVEDRTRDLAKTISELRALEEIGRAIASSLDLKRVLATIVARAVELAGADGGAVFSFYEAEQQFQLVEAHKIDTALVERLRVTPVSYGETPIGEAAEGGQPIIMPNLAETEHFPLREATLAAGFHSLLVVPLLGREGVLGALLVLRKVSGGFSNNTAGLMRTFADQSVLAMHNARLFSEVEEKGRQLALASEHKSQFFANMSHELRTPLNAVLGYTELLADGFYGEISNRAKEVLERVQVNGTHLLGLINDVLDLSKIEAGELALNCEEYSLRSVVEIVVASTGSLAQAKRLALIADVPDDLPKGLGDPRRLTQVLLNIVGNAIKFTDHGSVRISAAAMKDTFQIAIKDTGPGIAPNDRTRIFEAFHQLDNSTTRSKGGTGLGLSISKRLVEMHGGTIVLESELDVGSTFVLRVPIQAAERREAA
jgi:signal transduction histidine kinase/HAMP domain-containing protein